MLKTFVMDRGSGKTKEISERMKSNINSVALFHLNGQKKMFDEMNPEFYERTYTFDDLMVSSGENLRLSYRFYELQTWLKSELYNKTIFIDEGFYLSKLDTAKFFFELGKTGVRVEVFGTIVENKCPGYKIPSQLQRWYKKDRTYRDAKELVEKAFNGSNGYKQITEWIRMEPNSLAILCDMIDGKQYEIEELFEIPLPNLESENGKQYLTLKNGKLFACAKNPHLKQVFKERDLKYIPDFYKKLKVLV